LHLLTVSAVIRLGIRICADNLSLRNTLLALPIDGSSPLSPSPARKSTTSSLKKVLSRALSLDGGYKKRKERYEILCDEIAIKGRLTPADKILFEELRAEFGTAATSIAAEVSKPPVLAKKMSKSFSSVGKGKDRTKSKGKELPPRLFPPSESDEQVGDY
jgi:hypothetical protein